MKFEDKVLFCPVCGSVKFCIYFEGLKQMLFCVDCENTFELPEILRLHNMKAQEQENQKVLADFDL